MIERGIKPITFSVAYGKCALFSDIAQRIW